MAKRLLVRVFLSTLAGAVVALGCGATDDEGTRRPTPTQGPPTPTPLPICQGIDVPAGLGARAFTWKQPGGADAGTQLFTTLPSEGGSFGVLPSLADSGLDPGGRTMGIPPGFCLTAGLQDAEGIADVKIGVTPENQLIPGHFVIGLKPLLDYICLKIELDTVQGKLFCNGSTSVGVDTRTTALAGVTRSTDDVVENMIGDSAPPGSMILIVQQQLGRINNDGPQQLFANCADLPPCATGEGVGERFNCYRPTEEVAYTTGTVFGMKGSTPLLAPDETTMGTTGEPFDCSAWTETDGPGQLALGLIDFDTLGGDVSNGLRIDD